MSTQTARLMGDVRDILDCFSFAFTGERLKLVNQAILKLEQVRGALTAEVTASKSRAVRDPRTALVNALEDFKRPSTFLTAANIVDALDAYLKEELTQSS